MANEAARDRATNVLALLRNQLTDIAAVRKRQAELEVTAQTADGAVEVTVNARGRLVKTVIDNSYLDDHDFEELGDHITRAAQAAAREAAERVAAMLAPINKRHRSFPSFSDIVEGIPGPGDLMTPGLDAGAGPPVRRAGPPVSTARIDDDGDADAEFPTVRR